MQMYILHLLLSRKVGRGGKVESGKWKVESGKRKIGWVGIGMDDVSINIFQR